MDRHGKFAGDDPFEIARGWLAEAEETEINDPNAMALATADAGLPNVRMVLLKEIEDGAFVFYTNYESAKGQEIAKSGKAAMVLHWKSCGVSFGSAGMSSARMGAGGCLFRVASLRSRLGAWASRQSRPLGSRAELMAEVAKVTASQGSKPRRPPFGAVS